MFLYFIFLSLVATNVLGANILLISPIESVSHHIWNEQLVGGLLEKGHNITLIGHMEGKLKSENYTLLRFTGYGDLYGDREFTGQKVSSFIFVPIFWYTLTFTMSDIHLNSDVLEIILDYPKDKFDLIIFDIVCGQDFYPLIEHFGNPPVVGISPFSIPPYILDTMGSHFYYYYPFYTLPYTDDMTFFQRVENTLLYLLDYSLKYILVPRLYKKAQTRYGENITPFDEMEKKIGILLSNHDPVLEFAHPLPPNIIPVGGLHVKRSEGIPNDLQEILDNASDNGVIYFSFGTIVRSTWLSKDVKKLFLNVFSKLNQTVLWKYTSDDLTDVPKNVVLRKWYSQSDVLAHKNVKLFITHSGGLSNQEVIYHGVPVLGIPFFADQEVIAKKMEARKLGTLLHLASLTEDILYETILETINNPIYKENMQRMSRLFRDQKETPLERAIFWIEYALRNKDLSHLSIKARDMSLFQRENLDVFGLIFILLVIVLVVLFVLIKYIVKRLICNKKHKVKQN